EALRQLGLVEAHREDCPLGSEDATRAQLGALLLLGLRHAAGLEVADACIDAADSAASEPRPRNLRGVLLAAVQPRRAATAMPGADPVGHRLMRRHVARRPGPVDLPDVAHLEVGDARLGYGDAEDVVD